MNPRVHMYSVCLTSTRTTAWANSDSSAVCGLVASALHTHRAGVYSVVYKHGSINVPIGLVFKFLAQNMKLQNSF